MPASVRVTRRCHPFEGRVLAVLGGMRRHSVLELLVVLPDGSKALLPARWTDTSATENVIDVGTLGSLADLLHA